MLRIDCVTNPASSQSRLMVAANHQRKANRRDEIFMLDLNNNRKWLHAHLDDNFQNYRRLTPSAGGNMAVFGEKDSELPSAYLHRHALGN